MHRKLRYARSKFFTKAGSSNFAATARLSAGVVRSVPCPEPEAVNGRMTAARFFSLQ